MEDLREQLLQIKKAHSVALRENAQCRTRLRIAERECKRREAEIQRLLSISNWNSSTAPGGGPAPELRLELAALKRKMLLYERMLHEKSQENAKLMTDKGVVQASEARKQAEKLENECQRLRTHLAQSVPETEFLREKDQYLAIINRLVEENMHLRQVIGEFEQRRRESEKLLTQLGGGDALVRQFRHSSISSRRQANFYKNALGNLLKSQRGGVVRRRAESMNAAVSSPASNFAKNNGLGGIKAILEESRKVVSRRRASLGSGILEELRTLDEEEGALKEEEGEEEEGEMNGKGRIEKERKKKKTITGGEARREMKKKKTRKMYEEEADEEEEEITRKERMRRNGVEGMQKNGEEGGENGNDGGNDKINGHRPRSASSPEQMLSLSSRSGSSNEQGNGNGEEREEEEDEVISRSDNSSKRRHRREVGMDEEDEDGADGPADLETHLTALYRVLYAHVVRQQMAKVRQEREPPIAGMHLF